MIAFFKLIIYTPLYNFLLLILDVLPRADIGVAVIILTLMVRLILYPLSRQASVMQVQLKEHQPELDAIKEKYKSPQEQAKKTMEFYKKYKINPFSSFFTVLLQIPIIYSLYYLFVRSGLPTINTELLYKFTSTPDNITTSFLGLVNIAEKSIWLAALAALSGYIQIRLSMGATSKSESKTGEKTFKDDLASAMSMQMKYFFPFIIFIISWKTSAVLALYWLTSNLLSILQDWRIRSLYAPKLETHIK